MLDRLKPPELPKMPAGLGPSVMPRPGEKAPHQDAGAMIVDFIGDLNSIGKTASGILDKPLEVTAKINGPHKIVENAMDTASRALINGVNNLLK